MTPDRSQFHAVNAAVASKQLMVQSSHITYCIQGGYTDDTITWLAGMKLTCNAASQPSVLPFQYVQSRCFPPTDTTYTCIKGLAATQALGMPAGRPHANNPSRSNVGIEIPTSNDGACISRCGLGQGTLQRTACVDPLERVSVLERRSATPPAAATAQAPMPSALCGAAASHVAVAMPHLKNCNLLRHRKPTPEDSPLCCQASVEQGSCGAVAAKCVRRCVRFRRAWAPVASL